MATIVADSALQWHRRGSIAIDRDAEIRLLREEIKTLRGELSGLVSDSIAALPKPTNGRDGENGKDADPITPEMVVASLESYFSAHPIATPKDGDRGADGREGLGITNALVDAEGVLVLTMTDGSTKSVGRVVGMPGQAGRDGMSIQGPKGNDGSDGADGLGFDDIHVEHDGERAFTFKFKRGAREKTFGAFTIPSVIYREVWKEGTVYQKGDCVTWAGSLFVAQCATKTKPETGPDWRLAVKRGRDGRDK